MRIAVIGAGAIGSIVAAYLTKSGVDVTLLGRADQVAAIRKNGLKVIKRGGEEIVKVQAIEKIDSEYDLVIFATKTQDIQDAYQRNANFLENCFVLTTQNGVQADNLLSTHFEREKMISSIVMFGATYIKPGEVVDNFPGDWIIGKPFVPNDQKLQEIVGILRKSFSVEVTPEILGMKYLKLFVNFNNCIPALTGKSMQETFADIDLCRLSVLLLKEGLDVVESVGIKLVSMPQFSVDKIYGLINLPIEQSAGIIQKTLTTLSKEPLYGSILQSIMRKRTSEIDFINGEVTHLAHNIHKKTPLNSKVVDLVHRVEREGRFFTVQEIKKEFSL